MAHQRYTIQLINFSANTLLLGRLKPKESTSAPPLHSSTTPDGQRDNDGGKKEPGGQRVVGNLSPDLVVCRLKPVRSTLTSDAGMLSNDSLEGIKDS